MTITLSQQLSERLKENLAFFKEFILRHDKALIYVMARDIAAVEDAYWQLTTQTDFDDDDAEFLLKFKNPLVVIADMWASHLDEQGVDFDGVLYEFYDDEMLKQHPLVSDPEEVSGDEFDAAMFEFLDTLVETSKSVLGYLKAKHGLPPDDDE